MEIINRRQSRIAKSTVRGVALVALLALLYGCGTTQNRLSDDERLKIGSLVFIPKADADEHRGRVVRTESYEGTTITMGLEEMSPSTYNRRTASAFKKLSICLSETFGEAAFGSAAVAEMLDAHLREQNPLNIKRIPVEDQEKFWGLSRDEKAQYIEGEGADAALIIHVYHLGGLRLPAGIVALSPYEGAYSGLRAWITDYGPDDTDLFRSATTFTDALPTSGPEFCSDYVKGFYSALENFISLTYSEISGT